MSKPSQDPLAADQSPGRLKASHGVRRINNKPMAIVLVFVVVVMGVILLAIFSRGSQDKPTSVKSPSRAGRAHFAAEEIVGTQRSGTVPMALDRSREKPTQSDGAAQNQSTAPVSGTTPPNFQTKEPANAFDNTVMSQALQKQINKQIERQIQAMQSDTTVALRRVPSDSAQQGAPGKGHNSGTQTDRVSEIQSKMAALRTGSDGSQATLTSTNTQATMNRWRLGSEMQIPESRYIVQSGAVIPGVMISGINSELPGTIIAQVSQNVYDSATGKYLLLPQGSRLLGVYPNQIAYGQSKVMIIWNRILFPDGKTLDIGEMPGADMAGYSGFKDSVNNHYFRLFSSAILMSSITAGISYSVDQYSDDDDSDQSLQGAMAQSLGQQLGQVTADLIRKNMNIAPTIEIRPGYQFNVIVTKDLVFEGPYRAFDYE